MRSSFFVSGWRALRDFPWRQMAGVLLGRFRDARLGVSASSLTFTTVLALVPLFAVALALFTAFPMFGKFQDTLQRWLLESLVPESISRQVLSHVTQFARKASRLGSVGLVAVLVTAVALMVTIDRTLGQIWRLQRQRPLAQRILLYWAAITLGPLLLGGSLAITSYLLSVSGDVVQVPGLTRWLLDAFEFALLVACVSGLYFYVPYTRVRWRHAFIAGLLVALGIELAKNLLAVYLSQMPTYSAIYGAFAAVPILLVWIYVAWVVVLLGAVVAASLPDLGRQQWRVPEGPGWHLRLALETVGALQRARQSPARGVSRTELSHTLHCAPDDLSLVVDALQALDWVGPLREEGGLRDARLVLLVEPERTPAAPLFESLLLHRLQGADPLWDVAGLDRLQLAQLL
jgi:membrane protein